MAFAVIRETVIDALDGPTDADCINFSPNGVDNYPHTSPAYVANAWAYCCERSTCAQSFEWWCRWVNIDPSRLRHTLRRARHDPEMKASIIERMKYLRAGDGHRA